MKIKILPEHIINQISAGEVVERPSSVVRELVENSIDAGATKIEVYLEEGGKEVIRIIDNGCGMTKDEALLAFERYATSKISSQADLERISSLGFRGEALPSIASVSNIFLKTKTANCSTSTQIEINAGKLKNCINTSGQTGTLIEIASLFYNTPARKKFLKTSKTESLKVKTWLKNTSLAHPTIHFKLFFDNKEVLNLIPKDSIIQRAKDFYSNNAVEISYREHGLKIKGLLSHPSISEKSKDSLAILVNGRVIQDRLILKAIKEGFSSTLKYQDFPVGFVTIEINPEFVDVNVHPQKSEVRFTNPEKIFLSLKQSVATAIKEFKLPVSFNAYNTNSAKPEVTFIPQESFDFSSKDNIAISDNIQEYSFLENKNQQIFDKQKLSDDNFKFRDLNYIGQAFDCYLFCEKQDEVYIIDMHAAHERYNFNLVQSRFFNKKPESQILLIPVSVPLSEQGLENCLANQEFLASFGFNFEQINSTTILLKAIPSMLNNKTCMEVIKDISCCEHLKEAESVISKKIDYICARIACHSSIRGGDKLSRSAVYSLLANLDSTEFSGACPHGRPVVFKLSKSEIEKWFLRA